MMKHIYHIGHICECGLLYDHSQGELDEWKNTCWREGHKLHDISNDVYDAIINLWKRVENRQKRGER